MDEYARMRLTLFCLQGEQVAHEHGRDGYSAHDQEQGWALMDVDARKDPEKHCKDSAL